MRRNLVVGNWKMNGSKVENKVLLEAIINNLQEQESSDVVVCVPYPYFAQAQSIANGSRLAWGAQNLCANKDTALTGAVSPEMLIDYGCTYVIIGHSERRVQLNETDDTAAVRFAAAINSGLTPIFCMGETKEERVNDGTEYVVGRQLDAILRRFGPEVVAKSVLAYEPLWAVGTDIAATPEQAQEVHSFIRKRIARCDKKIAKSMQILYGGSLNPENALALFAMPDIDGGLVGRCSLNAKAFIQICKAVDKD
jgi:triosephosphate isomerase (TIM)